MLHVLEEKLYWQERGYAENPGEYHVSSAVSVGMTGPDWTNRSNKQQRDRENGLSIRTSF